MTAETCEIMEPFGPVYPALPSVAKFRRMANGRDLTKEEGKAYGRAVMQGILDLQKRELQREFKSHACPSASGSWATDGKTLIKAVRKQHQDQLEAAVRADRARRTDAEIVSAYHAAMEETRAARAAQEAKRQADEAAKVEQREQEAQNEHKVEAEPISNVVAFVPAPAPVPAAVRPASPSLTKPDGSYDRGAIMREAHALAREMRAINPGKAYKDHLSEAMRDVWALARETAPVKMAA